MLKSAMADGEDKTYYPQAIANFFIEKAAQNNKQLIPLQVMKLVYIAHGWYLGISGKPLLNDPPQAWGFGPVIPSLYEALKSNGNNPVTIKLLKSITPPEEYSPLSDDIRKFLEGVWQAYGDFSEEDLTALTKQPGTPWEKTWAEKGVAYSNGSEIPEAELLGHYKQLNQKVSAEAARMQSLA